MRILLRSGARKSIVTQSKQVDRLIESLFLFTRLRQEGVELLMQVKDRFLEAATPPTHSAGASHGNQIAVKSWRPSFRLFKRVFRSMTCAIGLRQRFFAERIQIVCINSRRELQNIDTSRIRNSLLELLQPRVDPDRPTHAPLHLNWMEALSQSKPIILVDPLITSDFLCVKHSLRNQLVFPIDTLGLIFLGSILRPIRYLQITYELYKRNQQGQKLNLSITHLLVAPALESAFEVMFNRSSENVELYLMTSNSLSIELLRMHAIETRRCDYIVEFMHGIPSLELERYLSKLFSTLERGLHSKHYFVPQLPLPLKDAPYGPRCLGKGRVFVNSMLTRRIRNELHKLDYETLDSLFKSEVVISFIGGTSHDSSYTASVWANIELQLMEFVSTFLTEKGLVFKLIYAPHPQVEIRDSEFIARLDRLGVQVLEQTALHHLVADWTIGLFSSALFEAKYFGSKVFTPIVEEDEIFDRHLMTYLNEGSPDIRMPLIALEEFLKTQISLLRPRNIIERAKIRAHRLNG